MTVCICAGCGKEFNRSPAHIRHEKQYCTKRCFDKSRRVPKTCARCGKEFSVELNQAKRGRGVYCSLECKRASREVSCQTCGKKFRMVESRIRKGGKYCSAWCKDKSHGRVPYEIMDGVMAIPLTKGKIALIDKQDLPLVERHSWCRWRHRNTTYATSGAGHLHALIMNTPKGMVTDHINGNGLDNRRKNLRVVTNQENLNNMIFHRKKENTIAVRRY